MRVKGRDELGRVRILMLGDEGVGKTSLVEYMRNNATVKENLPKVAEPLPLETARNSVGAIIRDSAAPTEDEEAILKAIKEADIYCVVYDVTDNQTFERVSSYWLPLLTSKGTGGPVLLVGNKIDKRTEDEQDKGMPQQLQERIMPLMMEYKEIETCVECSVHTGNNVHEVFYYAVKAVIHPTAPLYDSSEQKLTERAVTALTRVFNLCDKDHDSLLNDDELSDFQLTCFKVPLKPTELQSVKKTVSELQSGDGHRGLVDGMMTLHGFIYLNTTFIKHGRMETVWAILRRFGYNDDLELDEDFMRPSNLQMDDPTQVACFTDKGIDLLTDLFSARASSASKGRKKATMSKDRMNALFAVSEVDIAPKDFPAGYVQTLKSRVVKDGWLSMWMRLLAEDWERACQALAHLGCIDLETSVRPSLPRSKETGKLSASKRRTHMKAAVVGGSGAGKSSLLNWALNIPVSKELDRSYCTVMVPATTSMYDTALTMQVYGDVNELTDSERELASVDMVLVLVDPFDDDSVQYAWKALEQLYEGKEGKTLDSKNVPALLMLNKSDLVSGKPEDNKQLRAIDEAFDARFKVASETLSLQGTAKDNHTEFLQELLTMVVQRLSLVQPNSSSKDTQPPKAADVTAQHALDENEDVADSDDEAGSSKGRKTKKGKGKVKSDASVATNKSRSGSGWAWTLGGLGLVAAAGAGYWWLSGSEGGEEEPELL